MRKLPALLATSFTLLSAGCALIFKSHVDDLDVKQVVAVPIADVPLPGKVPVSPLARRLTAIEVTFSSTTDFSTYVLSHDDWTNLHTDIKFCDGSGGLGWGWVFYSGIDLESLDIHREARNRYQALVAALPKGARFDYQTWFADHTLLDRKGGDVVDHYDLRAAPADICITVNALPYMALGMGFTSNTIVVPKATIEKVLASGSPG